MFSSFIYLLLYFINLFFNQLIVHVFVFLGLNVGSQSIGLFVSDKFHNFLLCPLTIICVGVFIFSFSSWWVTIDINCLCNAVKVLQLKRLWSSAASFLQRRVIRNGWVSNLIFSFAFTSCTILFLFSFFLFVFCYVNSNFFVCLFVFFCYSYFILNGLERVVRPVIMPKRNYVSEPFHPM